MFCKQNFKKIISLFLAGVMLCCSIAISPANSVYSYAANPLYDLSDFLDDFYKDTLGLDFTNFYKNVDSLSHAVNDILSIPIRYFTKDKNGNSGGGSSDTPSNMTQDPIEPTKLIRQVNKTINNVNQTINQIYDYDLKAYVDITNTYVTNNNDYSVTTNNTYNSTTIYETNNNYYALTNNYNYVSYVVGNSDGLSYRNIYFELPDGSSSLNLTKEQIDGVIFVYDVVNYENVVLDEGIIGYYDFDLDFSNKIPREYSTYSPLFSSTADYGSYIYGNGFANKNYSGFNTGSFIAIKEPYDTRTFEFLFKDVSGNLHFASIYFDGSSSSILLNNYADYPRFGRYPSEVYIDGSLVPYSGYAFYYDSLESFIIPIRSFSDMVPNGLSEYGLPTYKYVFNASGNFYQFDDLRVYSVKRRSANFDPVLAPYDFQFAFTVPDLDYDSDVSNIIAIQSAIEANKLQIGGIRSINPSRGDVFVEVLETKATSVQQFYDGFWHEVTGAVFYSGRWHNLLGFDFFKMSIDEDSSQSVAPTIIYNVTNNYYGDGDNNVSIDIPGIDEPLEPGNEEEGSSILLPLIAAIAFLSLMINILGFFIDAVAYLGMLIAVPATTEGLDQNFISAFSWLRGEIETIDPITGQTSVPMLHVGDLFSITYFDFMVVIFQIALIGLILMFARKLFDDFTMPKFD